jgi:phenylalanyl-tRNA synthetase alpha chain
MKDIAKLADSLQDNEAKVLRSFGNKKELCELSGMPKNEFLRAGMWLDNKGLIQTRKTKTRFIQLDELGKKYVKSKLPELAVLAVLKKRPYTLDELKSRFPEDELRFAVGYLKQKSYVEFRNGTLAITDTGLKVKLTLEFQLLLKIAKLDEIKVPELMPEEQYAYQQIRKRKKLVQEIERVFITFSITDLGKQVIKNLSNEKRVGILTPSMIKTGSWNQTKFRRYDVSAPVPRVYPGKKQPYMQYLDDIRAKLVKLGFKEMSGPLVETEFWHFDAMYQPQNHPARTWSDTYSIKNLCGKLPDAKLVATIKAAHETGGNTGSTGWGYKWSENVASKVMPRGHGTCTSARQLAKGITIPGKYFALGRVYRPDVLDATHLIEFNQVDCIVIGKDANMKNLLGMLKQFAKELAGATEVRFNSDYFPFTEPSVQISAKHPKLGWVELAGAGIFRPEFTKSLGIKEPVLAFAFGVDRLAMYKLGINDIRYLFSQDLDWLRKERIIK